MQLSGARGEYDRLSADSLSRVCNPFSQPPTSQQGGNSRLSALGHLIQSACTAIGSTMGALMRVIKSYYRTGACGSQRHEQIGYRLFLFHQSLEKFGSSLPLKDTKQSFRSSTASKKVRTCP